MKQMYLILETFQNIAACHFNETTYMVIKPCPCGKSGKSRERPTSDQICMKMYIINWFQGSFL